MLDKLSINKRQIPLYIFMVFFCYLFIFQDCLVFFLDEAMIILLIPVISFFFRRPIKLRAYMVPVMIMCALIFLWSTEKHKSFLYYLILVEAVFCIRPEINDSKLIIRVIKRTALINAFFVLVCRLFPRIMMLYAKTVFPSFTASAYISAVQGGRYPGLNSQQAFTAVYLGIGVFAFVYDQNEAFKSKIWKLCLLLFAMLATGKRSHLIYLMVAMLVVYYSDSVRSKKFDKAIKIFFIALLLVGVIVALSVMLPNVPIFSKFRSVTLLITGEADANQVLSGRVAIYNQEIELYRENRMWGVGWQNFGDYSRYHSTTGGVNQGHNVFLQLLCETGTVGIFIFMLINVFYFVFSFKANRIYVRYLKEETDLSRINVFNNLDTCRKCAIAFMVFYYLFWFSGNALYDFTFVYTWLMGVFMSVTVFSYFSAFLREGKRSASPYLLRS